MKNNLDQYLAIAALVISIGSVGFSYLISTQIQQREHEFQGRMFALAQVHEIYPQVLDYSFEFEGNFLTIKLFPNQDHDERIQSMGQICNKVVSLVRSSRHQLAKDSYEELMDEAESLSQFIGTVSFEQYRARSKEILLAQRTLVENVRKAYEETLAELATLE